MRDATLKPGWTRVSFGDVVRQVKDRVDPQTSGLERYIAGEHMDTDDLRIRRWGTIDDGYLGPAFHMRFKPGQVLYGSRRTYLRKVAVPDFEGICANTTFVLESKDASVLLPELLPFVMQTEAFHDHSTKQSKGSVNPYVNFSDLAWYEFALPPLEEQRRIGGILGATRIVQDNLQEAMTANSQLWFAVANQYFPVHNPVNDNTVELEHLVEYASDGPFGSKLKTIHYSNDGARVIRLQNIDRQTFNDEDKAYISLDYYHNELLRYAVYPCDVLIAGLGDESIPAGRACLAPDDLGPAINKADCYCVRPNQRLEPRYLVAFLNSPSGLLQSAAFTQGTTRYRLNLGNVKKMKIPLPSRASQCEIADQLDTIYLTGLAISHRGATQSSLFRTLIDSLLGGL